ncbi:uncharacterized protein LOC121652571 isoform X2 [Melanotaenia boesemani]|uniref:uncharacterized protein LOC121652571 isoform X2 n=1 Tax=Melanotaenia boesemani TaxID=1250792 RepID=UPI001C04AB97|nr:uncharacterized protein LOC121652571 isoform X2 [Melanotaenia boesemani]
MEMWLKCAALVLFVVAGAALEKQRNIITLDEKESSPPERKEEVPPGSSLTFRFSLNSSEDRYRVYWYFNPSGPNFTKAHKAKCEVMTFGSAKNSTEQPQLEKSCYNKDWDLTNVNESNAGWYFSKVIQEIPAMQTKESQIIKLIISKSLEESTTYLSLVTSKQVPPESSNWLADWWLWILLGASSLILIILLVACAIQRQRACRSREEPVYANTRTKFSGDSSPRPSLAVNNLKSVPSSQHLRTPSPGRRYEEGTRRKK